MAYLCLFLFFIGFKTESYYVAQAGLESIQSSCLSVPSAGITDMPHYALDLYVQLPALYLKILTLLPMHFNY